MKILSLGAGVQSSTVLLMSCVGELPKLDAAIFADVGWEPAAVYAHLEYLKTQAAKCGIPIHVISKGNLRQNALISQIRGATKRGANNEVIGRWASMPLFTYKLWTPDQADDFEQCFIEDYDGGDALWSLNGDDDEDRENQIRRKEEHRQLLLGFNVEHSGMIRRQCTYEYKIRPIETKLRELAGAKPRVKLQDGLCQQYFGISWDEPQRMRVSQKNWIENIYPLIDKRMSRHGCIAWLEQHNFPPAPRSACIGCPFHSDVEWLQIKSNPVEWADAVEFDYAIRNCGGMRGQVFLHAARMPLSEIDFRSHDQKAGQLMLAGFGNECEGHCGV